MSSAFRLNEPHGVCRGTRHFDQRGNRSTLASHQAGACCKIDRVASRCGGAHKQWGSLGRAAVAWTWANGSFWVTKPSTAAGQYCCGPLHFQQALVDQICTAVVPRRQSGRCQPIPTQREMSSSRRSILVRTIRNDDPCGATEHKDNWALQIAATTHGRRSPPRYMPWKSDSWLPQDQNGAIWRSTPPIPCQ